MSDDTDLEALLARWDDTERPDGWNAGDEHHLATLVINALRGTTQPVQVEVTDEMVERAAEAMWDRWGTAHMFKHAPAHRQNSFRTDARAALTAALGGGD